MLDKVLCDEAKVASLELFNGRIVTIYQWLIDGQLKHCYSIEDSNASEYLCNQYLANYGDPIAWGFSN